MRASPARPRRCGLQPVISRPSSSIVPAVGKSNPVIRLTSVDLPAPFGPIRPTTSCRWSSSVTSSSACTPSNERETERARNTPCGGGLSVFVSQGCARFHARPAVAPGVARSHRRSCHADQIFGMTLAVTDPTTLRLVALDPDHAVLPAEHAVQRRREAHEPRERRHLLELLHLRGERRAVRRVARARIGGDEAVDRRCARDEAARSGLDGLRQLVDGGVRIVAERRGVGHGVVVRDAVLRHPVGAVAGPRVEDRRLVAERAQPRHERGELAERGRRDVDVRILARRGG